MTVLPLRISLQDIDYYEIVIVKFFVALISNFPLQNLQQFLFQSYQIRPIQLSQRLRKPLHRFLQPTRIYPIDAIAVRASVSIGVASPFGRRRRQKLELISQAGRSAIADYLIMTKAMASADKDAVRMPTPRVNAAILLKSFMS